MFFRYSYFLAKSEADVLIKSVLIKRKACSAKKNQQGHANTLLIERSGHTAKRSWRPQAFLARSKKSVEVVRQASEGGARLLSQVKSVRTQGRGMCRNSATVEKKRFWWIPGTQSREPSYAKLGKTQKVIQRVTPTVVVIICILNKWKRSLQYYHHFQ